MPIFIHSQWSAKIGTISSCLCDSVVKLQPTTQPNNQSNRPIQRNHINLNARKMSCIMSHTRRSRPTCKYGEHIVYRAMAWIGLYTLQKLAVSHYSSLMRYIQMTGHYARRRLHTVSTTTVRWRLMRSMLRCGVSSDPLIADYSSCVCTMNIIIGGTWIVRASGKMHCVVWHV